MRRRLLALLATSALALVVGVTTTDHAAAEPPEDRRTLEYEGLCRAGDVSFDIISTVYGPGWTRGASWDWSLNPEVVNRGTRTAQVSVQVVMLPNSPRAVPMGLVTRSIPVAAGATSRNELLTTTESSEIRAMFEDLFAEGARARATVTAKVRVPTGWRSHRWVTYTQTCDSYFYRAW